MRDHMHNFGAVSAIVPAVLAAEPAAVTIDRQGFDALTFVVQIGAGGITFNATNRIDLVLEHSNDGTTWDAVGGSNVLGADLAAGGIVLSQRTAHATPTVHRFGYVDGYQGERRYVRLRSVFAGTHGTGTPIAATAILGNPRNLPVAA